MKNTKQLQLRDIEKSFSYEPLFTEVDLTLSPGDHVAIIGDNGAGKSTLMRIMAGLEEYDDGQLLCPEWMTRHYVAQEYLGDPKISPEELLKQVAKPAKAYEVAASLGLDFNKQTDLAKQPMDTLSGGQKRIVELAAAIGETPSFLFIDEPENHLDIVARSQLTAILKSFRGCVCVVSHDRYLINELADKIIEVAHRTTRLVSDMTYEQFRDLQRRELAGAQRQWTSEKKAVEKLEKAVRILGKQAFRGTNTATYQERKRELAERKEALAGGKPSDNKRLMRPEKDSVKKKSGKLIVQCEKISLRYPGAEKDLFSEVDLDLRFGQKRVILGRNGAGKTSLVNLLLGKIKPTSGSIKFGNDIKVELFEQSLSLDEAATPLDLVMNKLDLTETPARGILGRYAFNKDLMDSPIHKLSGGQKARLRFALTFSSKPEFLLLDEPTNNLDPDTWEVLVEHVKDYPGTIVIISHDRAFIEHLETDRFWVIRKDAVKETNKDLEGLLERLQKDI